MHWAALPPTFTTPAGEERTGAIEGAQIDGKYLLVGRYANDPPSPYATVTGEVSIAYDSSVPNQLKLNVTRTYQDNPAPPPSPVITWTTFVARFTDVEWAGVKKAVTSQENTGNGALSRWIALATFQGIDVTAAQTLTYKAQLVSAGILTQPRADAIFVAQ